MMVLNPKPFGFQTIFALAIFLSYWKILEDIFKNKKLHESDKYNVSQRLTILEKKSSKRNIQNFIFFQKLKHHRSPL